MNRQSMNLWTRTLWATNLLCLLLLLAGCGCSYGKMSAASVTPGTPCLDVKVTSSCASLELTVSNSCSNPLKLTGTASSLTVMVGETKSLDPGMYGNVTEDNGNCTGTAKVPATLGKTNLVIEFTFELVNRGVGGC
jgi:hypothetical protein